jgi:hypothetical protein
VTADCVIHLAGSALGARQECSRCGAVLQEYTGNEAFRVDDMPDPGDATSAYTFWPVGEEVMVCGGGAFSALVANLSADRDTSDEQPCG